MGLLEKRRSKIAEGAREHLGDGEEVAELALANVGSSLKGRNMALIATERAVYVVELALLGLTRIRGVAARIPIERAEVAVDDRRINVGEQGSEDVYGFYLLLGAEGDAKRLASYVAARSAASSSLSSPQ